MRDEQQFEQLMLQYEQLKNGSNDIFKMINEEDYDGAITMINSREAVFLNCKCIRKYLELSPAQEKKVKDILEEIRELEQRNIKLLSENITKVKSELVRTQKAAKINMAYDFNDDQKGSIINIKE